MDLKILIQIEFIYLYLFISTSVFKPNKDMKRIEQNRKGLQWYNINQLLVLQSNCFFSSAVGQPVHPLIGLKVRTCVTWSNCEENLTKIIWLISIDPHRGEMSRSAHPIHLSIYYVSSHPAIHPAFLPSVLPSLHVQCTQDLVRLIEVLELSWGGKLWEHK